jgi:hypothetical protein
MSDKRVYKKPGYLYVIEDCHGNVKVGRSINLERRINCVCSSVPQKIVNTYVSERCLEHYFVENYIKKILIDKKIKGEWFRVSFDEAVGLVRQTVELVGLCDDKTYFAMMRKSNDDIEEFLKELAQKSKENKWKNFVSEQRNAAKLMTEVLKQKGYNVDVYALERESDCDLWVKTEDGGEMGLKLYLSILKLQIESEENGDDDNN